MNKVNIEPTKFINTRTGSETYGYRAYDDEGQTYCNTFVDPPADDDLDFLEQVMENSPDEILQGMLDFVLESESGLYIGGEFYPHEEIKDIITD